MMKFGGGKFIIDNFIELINIKNEMYKEIKSSYTNFYDTNSCNSLSSLLIRYDNDIIILEDNVRYYKLYYMVLSEDKLLKIMDLVSGIMTNKPVIFEYVYRKKQDNFIDKISNNTSFLYYGGIIRLQKKLGSEEIYNEKHDSIMFATHKDINEIMHIHANIFNEYIDRMLRYSELRQLIENNNVIIYRYNNKILGCIIFVKRGKFYHLRYWFIDKNNIGSHKGIGRELIHEFYKVVGVGNFIEVWSRKDNNIVTNIYEHYGFKKDGLESDIFIYCRENTLISPLISLN